MKRSKTKQAEADPAEEIKQTTEPLSEDESFDEEN